MALFDTETDYDGGTADLRGVIETWLPDEPNYRRVRTTGGSENRVGEVKGGSRDEHDFKAIRAPFTTREDLRAGASGTSGDLELHILDDVLEEGDRVETIDGPGAYEVEEIEDFDWQGEQVGLRVTLKKQHD